MHNIGQNNSKYFVIFFQTIKLSYCRRIFKLLNDEAVFTGHFEKHALKYLQSCFENISERKLLYNVKNYYE